MYVVLKNSQKMQMQIAWLNTRKCEVTGQGTLLMLFPRDEVTEMTMSLE